MSFGRSEVLSEIGLTMPPTKLSLLKTLLSFGTGYKLVCQFLLPTQAVGHTLRQVRLSDLLLSSKTSVHDK